MTYRDYLLSTASKLPMDAAFAMRRARERRALQMIQATRAKSFGPRIDRQIDRKLADLIEHLTDEGMATVEGWIP